MGEVKPAQAFLHFQPGQFRMPRGASAAHALFTQRGTIHLTPYGPKTESEQSSRVTLVGVTLAVGKGSFEEMGGPGLANFHRDQPRQPQEKSCRTTVSITGRWIWEKNPLGTTEGKGLPAPDTGERNSRVTAG